MGEKARKFPEIYTLVQRTVGAEAAIRQQAHEAADADRQHQVRDIEAQIEELAARAWGLTEAELSEIQQLLAELRG